MKTTPGPVSTSSSSRAPLPTAIGHPTTRRAFLRHLSVAGAAAPYVWSGTAAFGAAANSMVNHACIGVAGMGEGDLQNFRSHPKVQIVALCDVDDNNLRRAASAVPGARTYHDWRELLEKEGDKIDSVNVTVPDHMHFPIAFSAVNRGKHVYCQKPLCHDVAEVRALTQAAVAKGVVTQLGTQMASGVGDRTTVEWLRAGAIGKVKHAYLCANRPGAVEAYRLQGPRPSKGQEPPPQLHWDLWLGTAPVRPFAPEIYHPLKWRAWLDFGTGWSGDIGCHVFDAVWKGLDLKQPTSVIAEVQESWRISAARRADTWPQGNHITWTFPPNPRVAGDELVVEWFDGDYYYPPDEIRHLYTDELADYPAESAMVIGTEGALLNPLGSSPMLLPEAKFKQYPRPKLTDRNHYHHFIDAILRTAKNESHFAQTGPMTEAILLGTVAVRTPRVKLEWDHANLKVTNSSEANRYLKRDYRQGWTLG